MIIAVVILIMLILVLISTASSDSPSGYPPNGYIPSTGGNSAGYLWGPYYQHGGKVRTDGMLY